MTTPHRSTRTMLRLFAVAVIVASGFTVLSGPAGAAGRHDKSQERAARTNDRADLARQFYDAVDGPRPVDPEVLRRYFAPDFVDRNRPAGFDGLSDRDTIVTLLTGLADAFPDGQHRLERVERVGRDEVLVYWRFTGTHTGSPFLGTPAAGATVDFVGFDLFRVDRGRFVEQNHVEDLLTLTNQLRSS